MSHWYLECYVTGGKVLRRIVLDQFPFTVGRAAECSLTLNSPDVSRYHGEFIERNGQLMVRDLGSTNGVFINRELISGTCNIQHGDVVHFANMEFRFISEKEVEQNGDLEKTQLGISTLSSQLPSGLLEFQDLLDRSCTTAALQPIVKSDDYKIFGYEVLGRGCHPLLPQSPCHLFRIAESVDKEVELSQLLMLRGVELAVHNLNRIPLFINTHPREMEDVEALINHLERVRKVYPEVPLVLEIHEEAVTDLATMRRLREKLNSLQIKLAYDDFGAGQARLLELVDSPPDFIKFDIAFIRDIDIASPMRIRMIEALLTISKDSGITTLAEGVDAPEKAEICRTLGFDLLQGYHFPSIENIF